MIELNDIKAKAVQKHVFSLTMNGRKPNSFDPVRPSERQSLENGIVYVNDIEYGKDYPNSFMDIWYGLGEGEHPTLVYAHGGGFLFGDKITGDPLAVNGNTQNEYFHDLAKRGFNVISVNYCFATEYRAPAQIRQFNGLLGFLMQNADELNLDMNSVILMGSSAGADIAALYGLALCNEEYAKTLDIECSIKKERVKALILDEAALDLPSIMTSENMCILTSAWLGTSKLDGEIARKIDLVSHMESEYIPSFIISSNAEPWFYASASKLHEKLSEIGVKNEIWYVPMVDSEKLEHGFMTAFKTNKYAADCYKKMIGFVERTLKDRP